VVGLGCEADVDQPVAGQLGGISVVNSGRENTYR
jgi:hypothetical protein